jgi:DNA invertase Pin-like site-specific DNA recombinase
MKTYYAYTRVSTVKQGEKGSSLQEQKDAIRAYASAHNLTIVEWFEEMETAAKRGRTLFTRMIAALEKGAAAGVILHKVDRGARNLWDWARLQSLLDLGLEVHFVHESLDLNSRGGRLSANLQAVIAADYIWNLRDEVKKGVNGRLKQGLYPLPAPIGYLDRGKGQPKAIDPIKGPLVRRAFELYATGRYNFDGLRRELFHLGLRTRSGKTLSRCGLTTILNNPFYVGLIRIKRRGETFQGIHEPLIKKSLFDRVQDVLHRRVNAKVAKRDFLFRRLLVCAHCGYSLSGEMQKGRAYYRCHTSGCPTRCIREDAIERQVRANLSPMQFEPAEIDALREEVAAFDDTWKRNRKEHANAVRLTLAGIDDRLQRLTDAYLDQLVDRDSYAERRSALLHERSEVNDRLSAIAGGTWSPADECAEFLELAQTLRSSLEIGLSHEKREMLRLVTSNLVVDGKNVAIELRNPFRLVVECRRQLYGAPHRYEVRTRITKARKLAHEVWDHFVEEAGRGNRRVRDPDAPKEVAKRKESRVIAAGDPDGIQKRAA